MRYRALRWYKDGDFDEEQKFLYQRIDDVFTPIIDRRGMTQHIGSYGVEIKAEKDGLFFCMPSSGYTGYLYVLMPETNLMFNLDMITKLAYRLNQYTAYNELIAYYKVKRIQSIYDSVIKPNRGILEPDEGTTL